MGYSASAYTCYGYRTTEAQLFKEEEVQVRKGPKGAKFCPKTGKPLFEVKKVPLLENFDYCWEEFKIGKLSFRSIQPNPDSDQIIITVWEQRADSYKNIINKFVPDLKVVEKSKKVLKKALGKNWKEENWGIWTMLSESY